MSKKTQINLSRKYNGGVKINVNVKGVTYIIENDYLCEFLENMIDEKGYRIVKEKGQRFGRLKFNI